jgi:hypothetical protein
MLKFKEFVLNEAAPGKGTQLETIKLNLAKSFDDIKTAKMSKKPGDINSEILSINTQAAIYTKISTLLKSLAVELKKPVAVDKTKPPTNTLY